MRLAVFILIAALSAAAPAVSPRADTPDRVAIDITQGPGSAHASLDIRRTAHGFTDGTRAIPEPLLRALVVAATAPPAKELDTTRLRVDPGALRRAAEQRAAASLPPHTAARFVERVCDPANLPKLGNSSLWLIISANYDPRVDVAITLAGGEKLLLRAESEASFMLPWEIVRGGQSQFSRDPDLARAIAALLPPAFLNRGRINGDHLAEELVHVAEVLWRRDLERDAVDERSTTELAALRARFRITNELAGRIPLSPEGEIWNAHLTDPTDPRVGFDLTISVANDRLTSVASFLRDASGLAQRVRAVPWIAKLLQSNPSTSLRIQYRDERSLGSFTQVGIDYGLRGRNHEKLAAAVAPLLGRSVGFYVYQGDRSAYWILLPDDRAFMMDAGSLVPEGMPLDRKDELVTADGTPARRP